MDERKSVYVVVDDEQMTRVRSAMEDVTSLVDSLRLGCEIAYQREPTQEEGDAHEYCHDQSMGASHGSGECFVPMGSHHGWKCKCGTWVWGGPTVCQRCVDADAVKIALEWKAEADRLRKLFDYAGHMFDSCAARVSAALDEAEEFIGRAGEAERIVESARLRLACVAESMTEHAYQELASALEAPPRPR